MESDEQVRFDESTLIILMLVVPLSHVNIVNADVVQISGYVNDMNGTPIEGVGIVASSLGPPQLSYGYATTNAVGHYSLSINRPARLNSPTEDFATGRPVYEGYWITLNGGDGSMPIGCTINTENRDSIEQNFIMNPAGVIEFKMYRPDGTRIHEFPWSDALESWRFVYTTDSHWRVIQSQFLWNIWKLMVTLNTPNVINFPWNVPGFGLIILRADNDGKGFMLTRPGQMISLNLAYEIARTEFRVLKDNYMNYSSGGYVFSSNVSSGIESAHELLQRADSAINEGSRANLSDAVLNRTLWTGETMEVQRARQEIERYRKGDVTLQIIDANGKPAENAEVEILQTSHDFLFGALVLGDGNPAEVLDSNAFGLFQKAGMNLVDIPFHWHGTEPSLGHYAAPFNPKLRELQRTGFRILGEGLVGFEPGETYDTGLLDLSFDALEAKVYEHVSKVVGEYSDSVDYWIVVHGQDTSEHSLGFTWQQVTHLINTAVKAVRETDPTAKVLLYFDSISGYGAAEFMRLTYGNYTKDPYTSISLDEHDIDFDGIALALIYGSVEERPSSWAAPGYESPFMDLSSISRVLDWYETLSKPIYITEFNVPGNYRSNLGYWHRRVWDAELQSEWIDRFYTISFSKPAVKSVIYSGAIDQWDFQEANRGLLDCHQSCAPRGSYNTLKRLITEDWTTRLRLRTDTNGHVQFRGFAGNYTVTIRTKNGAFNFAFHVNERASQSFTIKLGRANAEHAITKAVEAVSKAKTEGRTIFLDKAENLLRDAQNALLEENYGQAMVLAEEANRAADSAVTWLIIPTIMAFAGGLLSTIILLRKRAKKTRLLGVSV